MRFCCQVTYEFDAEDLATAMTFMTTHKEALRAKPGVTWVYGTVAPTRKSSEAPARIEPQNPEELFEP